MSFDERLARLRSKSWHIGQCAVAAGVAWFIAHDVVGHPRPFFAPIVAVVCLGTSYGQRLRRVAEVTIGVAIGVFLADLLLLVIGTGAWQVTVLVALGDVGDAAAQRRHAVRDPGGRAGHRRGDVRRRARLRADPLGGRADRRCGRAGRRGRGAPCAAAASAASRPRSSYDASRSCCAAGARSAQDGDVERGLQVLADARDTERLIRELQDAADEGLSVIASSPFRRRHGGDVRRMVELVEPLDRAMRNTRVLVRRIAVSNYHHEPIPRPYSLLCEDLAVADRRDGRRAGVRREGAARCGSRCCGSARAPREVERVAGPVRRRRAGADPLDHRRPAADHRDGRPRGHRRAAAAAAAEAAAPGRTVVAMSEHSRPHHRPMLPGAGHFEAITGDVDPAARSEAADRCATLLVRGAHDTADEDVVARVVHLADTEGLDTLADLWSGVARGLARRLPVAAVPAPLLGVRRPGRRRPRVRRRPGAHAGARGRRRGGRPARARRGARARPTRCCAAWSRGDFADTLFRAAAFARVVAAGRAHVGASRAEHVVRLGPVGLPAGHDGRAARARGRAGARRPAGLTRPLLAGSARRLAPGL